MAHPGRGKPGRPATLSWLDELEEVSGVSGLPLFDWAEEKDRPIVVTASTSREER